MSSIWCQNEGLLLRRCSTPPVLTTIRVPAGRRGEALEVIVRYLTRLAISPVTRRHGAELIVPRLPRSVPDPWTVDLRCHLLCTNVLSETRLKID
jgi:hypothetical protein